MTSSQRQGGRLRGAVSSVRHCCWYSWRPPLDTDRLAGLGEADAAARLTHLGPNITAPPQRPKYVRIAARQFADPLVALLIAAALVSVGIGERFEGAVIAAIVLLNALLGFAQEPAPSGRCWH